MFAIRDILPKEYTYEEYRGSFKLRKPRFTKGGRPTLRLLKKDREKIGRLLLMVSKIEGMASEEAIRSELPSRYRLLMLLRGLNGGEF